MIRLGFRLPWCSAKAPFSTCPPTFWPPGNPLALGGSGPGGHFTPLQRCHGGGDLSFVPRVLRVNFCGAQGFGQVETSAGSLPPPWIFMKVTRELYLHARARGICLRVCLDDWLVLASSPEMCLCHSQQVLHLCRSLGFSLNEEKSDLRPSQRFKFLGMTFNTLQC